MKYTEEFKEVVETGVFVGTGNPNSKVLIVGKEAATNEESTVPIERQNTISIQNNSKDWIENIANMVTQESIKPWVYDESLDLEKVDNNPLFAFKGCIKKNTADTWKKYQKLYDIVFRGEIDRNNELELDFQKDFFITEMSEIPAKTTNKAQRDPVFKEKLKQRKNTFFKSEYIQSFPVVILACSNYIVNDDKKREIDEIFEVRFKEEKGPGNQKFWIHESITDKPKLVIHTRQLSNAVEDDLLIGIANEIRNFLKKNDYLEHVI